MNLSAPSSLTGSHRRTHDAIFRHPTAHNLAWQDVRALLSHLGQVEEEPDGTLKVLRHGQVLVLPPPCTKEGSTTEEIMALRQYLQGSEASPPTTAENIALVGP